MPGEYVYNSSVANKDLELIGKDLGVFIDRKEIGLARMSDEELDVSAEVVRLGSRQVSG